MQIHAEHHLKRKYAVEKIISYAENWSAKAANFLSYY